MKRKSSLACKILEMAVFFCLMSLLMGFSVLADEDKTVILKNNTWYVGEEGYDTDVYHKIAVKKTGYLTIQGYGLYTYENERYSISVKLYNSKRKEIKGSTEYLSGYSSLRPEYTCCYAVKKGTYYLKTDGIKKYQLRYSFKAVNEKSGAKKGKAVSVKKNKIIRGTLNIGESKNRSDWYKIKLTRAQRVKFMFRATGNAHLYMKIIPANSKVFLSNSMYDVMNGKTSAWTQEKLPAGTYYIQILKYDNNDSGYYTLKWK